MRNLFLSSILAISFAGVAEAADSWGLTNEEIVRFDGTVVDVLAELTGQPSVDCGGGKHQLGIEKADGTLVLAVKNKLPFAGATGELIDFCGQEVTVDGLMTGHGGTQVLVVQFVRPKGGEWRGGTRAIGGWKTGAWAEANGFAPDGPEVSEWFRHDKRILDALERDGFLGLGEDADRKFLAEQ